MKPTLNIALLGRDFLLSGGADFLRNLANALLSMQDEHRLRLFLLLPVRNRLDTLTDLLWTMRKTAVNLVDQRSLPDLKKAPDYDPSFPDYFANLDGSIEAVPYNAESGLLPALRKIDADVVLPVANSLGSSFPLPWVGYAYDFQHKYFPDYFTARECLGRDIRFATMLRDAKAILVNARSVKEDIGRFFPYSDCEVFNLPFSAAPVSAWLDGAGPEVAQRYGLPSRYLLISNQFWIHKSHLTAFRALARLEATAGGNDLHIVCTGKMEDYRFPDHIRNLQREVQDLELAERVHFLGHIPKIDQIAIMKNALAVLQPTLFEGGPGGGAVYDAVSLGVPAILSDIPVNREIAEERNLVYFEAGSAENLADKISAFLQQEIRRPTHEELTVLGKQRQRLMGERILKAIAFVRGTGTDRRA